MSTTSRAKAWLLQYGPLLSRIIAALLGGYGLAAMVSVAALALPLARSEAALAGLLTSFLVYTAAVIWVFAVRNAAKAWLGLALSAAVLLPLVVYAMQRMG